MVEFQKKVANALLAVRDSLEGLRFESGGRVCLDTSPLTAAASDARSGDAPWGYELNELRFAFPKKPSGLKPTKLTELTLELNLKLESRTTSVSLSELVELTINIVLTGKAPNRVNCAAWHIELHDGSPSDYAHPFFHLQYGGNRFEAVTEDLGQTIATDAPRLTMPPMDAVLAIDFVLSNFYGPEWQICRDRHSYKEAVIQSQEWLWRPWFNVLADSCENTSSRGMAEAIFPQLLFG